MNTNHEFCFLLPYDLDVHFTMWNQFLSIVQEYYPELKLCGGEKDATAFTERNLKHADKGAIIVFKKMDGYDVNYYKNQLECWLECGMSANLELSDRDFTTIIQKVGEYAAEEYPEYSWKNNPLQKPKDIKRILSNIDTSKFFRRYHLSNGWTVTPINDSLVHVLVTDRKIVMPGLYVISLYDIDKIKLGTNIDKASYKKVRDHVLKALASLPDETYHFLL